MRRVAVITGASAGLGAAFAIEYTLRYAAAQHCDELWLIARRFDRLAETKAAILRELSTGSAGTKPHTGSAAPFIVDIRLIPFDISGQSGVNRFRALLVEEHTHKPLSIILLINNAGFGIYGAFADTAQGEILSMIDTDIYALTGFCAAALPYMQAHAHIINTASMAAFLPMGNYCVYAAAKSYVLSFSLSLRAELQDKGIGVTAVCPGQIATEFAQRALNDRSAKMPRSACAPQIIAAHALRCAFKQNAPLAVWGIRWKLQAFLSRFIGRNFFAAFSFRCLKRLSSGTAPQK